MAALRIREEVSRNRDRLLGINSSPEPYRESNRPTSRRKRPTTTRGTTMTPLEQFKEQGKWASFHHAAEGPGETQQAYACEAKAMELYRDNPADREAMREEAKDFLWSADFTRKADAIDIELPQVYREMGLTTRKDEKGYIWLKHSGVFVDMSMEMRDIELAASHFASGWFAGRKAQREGWQ